MTSIIKKHPNRHHNSTHHQENKSMMQSELLLQTSWPTQSYFHPNLDHYVPNMGFYESDLENIEAFDDVCRWLCDDYQEIEEIQSEGGDPWSPDHSMKSSDISGFVESNDDMALESQIEGLLKAYADAMEMGQIELVKVIVRCINSKVNPIGPVFERIAFNLFKCAENEGDEYLKEELMKNFNPAFLAFFEIFPYGRFAHFTANSIILEAVSSHVESVHIVDFDIGEGTQWPPVMAAIAQQRKSLTITSVKLEEHDLAFKETKMQLLNSARNVGLNLKVQEVEFPQLVEVTFGNEFLAFNCMIGLPHMRRTRKRPQVIEFLNLAKQVLAENEGVITLGDGEIENSTNYASFFDGNLTHYKALYESMEWGFPSYLNEAKIALETLFIAPSISSLCWFQKWEEGQEQGVSRKDLGLKGRSMSRESLSEARELVKEGESPYGIRIEGDDGNEMVLEWRGTPLVKVSAWV